MFFFQEMLTDPSKQVKLGSLSGLVPKEKAMAFERILFRATRGNMFLRQEPVDEPVTDPISGGEVTIFLCSQSPFAECLGITYKLFGMRLVPFFISALKMQILISDE